MGTRKRIAIEQDPAVELTRRLQELWDEYDRLLEADKPDAALDRVVINERYAVEDRLAVTQATGLDGALAQLVLAHSFAEEVALTLEWCDEAEERRIKENVGRLIRSAVHVLVRKGGNLGAVPRAYVGPQLMDGTS